MVRSYDSILKMYNQWCGKKNKKNWDDLWEMCLWRMVKLTHDNNRRMPKPIFYYDIIENIITESTAEIMHYLFMAEKYEKQGIDNNFDTSEENKKHLIKPKTAKEMTTLFYQQNLCIFSKYIKKETIDN